MPISEVCAEAIAFVSRLQVATRQHTHRNPDVEGFDIGGAVQSHVRSHCFLHQRRLLQLAEMR